MAIRGKLPRGEQDVEETKEEGNADKREPFILQVSFWEPRAGPIRVWAKDKDHAIELASKMIPGAKDLTIHDCAMERDMIKEDMAFDDPGTGSGPPTSQMLN